jgi:outer membrane assembly lipoprotein YfiO
VAYAYYKQGDSAQAISALDKFIKLHPNHPNLDYALYLKALVNFKEDLGPLARVISQDLADRDPKAARESFEGFKELVTRYPESKYTPDSRERMVYLVEALARQEIHVARYYLSRGAYLAAVNRAQDAIVKFPNSPIHREALEVMIEGYDRMGMAALRDDARKVLQEELPRRPDGRRRREPHQALVEVLAVANLASVFSRYCCAHSALPRPRFGRFQLPSGCISQACVLSSRYALRPSRITRRRTLASSTGTESSMRRKKLRSIQSALESTRCARRRLNGRCACARGSARRSSARGVFSDRPLTPGRSAQHPRTMRSTFTARLRPPCRARRSPAARPARSSGDDARGLLRLRHPSSRLSIAASVRWCSMKGAFHTCLSLVAFPARELPGTPRSRPEQIASRQVRRSRSYRSARCADGSCRLPDVRVAHELALLAPDDERHLGVRLVPHDAIHDMGRRPPRVAPPS